MLQTGLFLKNEKLKRDIKQLSFIKEIDEGKEEAAEVFLTDIETMNSALEPSHPIFLLPEIPLFLIYENELLDIAKINFLFPVDGILKYPFSENEILFQIKFYQSKLKNYLILEGKKEQNVINSEEVYPLDYRAIADNATVGLYRTTPDGRVIYANNTLLRMLGFSSFDELAKININENYAPNYDRKKFIEQIEKDGYVIGLEDAWKRADGSIIYIRESARAIKDEKGNILFFDGIIEDISELKSKEKLLQNAELKFSKILEMSPDPITISTLEEGILVEVNESFCKVTGYSKEEVIGKSSLELKIIPSPAMREKLMKEVVDHGYVENFEINIRCKDGTIIPNLLSANLFEINQKKYLLAFHRNITELKKIQKEKEQCFKESERIRKKLQTVLDSIADGVVSLDKDWKYTYVNPQAVRMLKRESPEDLLGKNIWEEFPEDVEGPFHQACLQAFQEQKFIAIENYFEPWDQWFENRIYPTPEGVTIYFTDTTEKRKAAEKLKESEERFRGVFEHTGTASIIVDFDGKITHANAETYNVTGFKPEELIGKSWEIFVAEESLKVMKRYFNLRLKKSEFIPKRYEAKLKHADGTIRHCMISTGLIPDQKNLIITIWDITDRVKTEKVKKMLATAVENSMEAIIITDEHNKIIYVNKQFEELYGILQEEILGLAPEFLLAKKNEKKEIREIQKQLDKNKSWSGYLITKTRKDSLLETYVSAFPIIDKNGYRSNIVWILRDVTNEKQMERRLQQSQRLEAIGTLAGGIAHDFNNILTPMLGYAQLAKVAAKGNTKLLKYIDKIENSAERAKDLVNQILLFGRKTSDHHKTIDVVPVVKDVIQMIRSMIPSTIQIQANIQKLSSGIRANSTEIHQVLVNLCTNAYQAIHDKGTISITIEEIQYQQNTDFLPAGKYVKIEVSDDGEGIPYEIQSKIFEPYFTTKSEKGGSGLGLAMVHGIVKNSGGYIQIESEPGKFTTIRLYFPAVPLKKLKEKKAPVINRGEGTIVIVDDEKDILNLLEDMLSELGFKVLLFQSAKDVLNFFKSNHHKVDLLITDTTMPEITGDILAKEIRSIRKDIPIIIMTGYSQRIDKKNVQAFGNMELLFKPFNRGILVRTIQRLLNNSSDKGQIS